MKNLLKNALLVCLILCMTVCLGLFVAACGGDNAPDNPPQGTEEDDNSGGNNATEEDATTPEVSVAAGDVSVTAKGATKVYFIAAVGTYECTVTVPDGNSYTLAFGEEEHTVTATDNKFVFTVTPDDVFTKTGASSTTSGFEVTVTPAATYEDNAIKLALSQLSTALKIGNNKDLYAASTVINSFAPSRKGAYTFEFDVKGSDAYTVAFGGKSFDVDADNNSVVFDASTFEKDGQQLNASYYYVTITPDADNDNATVDMYVIQPNVTVGVGTLVTASPIVTPEVVDKHDNVLTFHFVKPEGVSKTPFKGAMYGGTFKMYEGTEVSGNPVFQTYAEGNFSEDFYFNVPEDDGDEQTEFTYTVVFTFDDDADSYIFYGQFWDNHVLSLVTDKDRNTTCNEEDDDGNGNFVYTFTAEEDGWYEIGVSAAFNGVNIKLSSDSFSADITAVSVGNETVSNVVYLEKDTVVTVTLTEGTYEQKVYDWDTWELIETKNVPSYPYDGISIYVIASGPLVKDGDEITEAGTYRVELGIEEGEWEDTILPAEITFTSATGGKFVLVSFDSGEYLTATADGEDAIYYNTSSWRYVNSYTFELAAGESITLEFNTDDYEPESVIYMFSIEAYEEVDD